VTSPGLKPRVNRDSDVKGQHNKQWGEDEKPLPPGGHEDRYEKRNSRQDNDENCKGAKRPPGVKLPEAARQRLPALAVRARGVIFAGTAVQSRSRSSKRDPRTIVHVPSFLGIRRGSPLRPAAAAPCATPGPAGRCARPGLLPLIGFLLLLPSCSDRSAGGRSESAGKEAVPVHVAVAIRRTIPIEIEAIGTVEAFSTVSVKS